MATERSTRRQRLEAGFAARCLADNKDRFVTDDGATPFLKFLAGYLSPSDSAQISFQRLAGSQHGKKAADERRELLSLFETAAEKIVENKDKPKPQERRFIGMIAEAARTSERVLKMRAAPVPRAYKGNPDAPIVLKVVNESPEFKQARKLIFKLEARYATPTLPQTVKCKSATSLRH